MERGDQRPEAEPLDPLAQALMEEELNTALKSLQEKLKHNENIKGEFEKTLQHIKSQAERTECQIKQEFEKLHQFLRDEEEATITALREEEEQKNQMMKEKMEEINRHISALSHTIKDMEEMMTANDVCFLKEIPVSMERVQISQPDPQMASGALIHVSQYLGNLPFRVWKKMQDIVQNTPVILDPNTANPDLILSDDLTSVRWSEILQPLPDNPERFDGPECVLGSEGFNSGTHSWDVEVKESQFWCLGVTTASNQRKGDRVFFNTDVWSVQYDEIGLVERFGFPVEQYFDHKGGAKVEPTGRRAEMEQGDQRPEAEALDPLAPLPQEELNTALKSLQEKIKHNKNIKGEFEKTVQHIKSQAECTERQIKQQFEKLHQFLRDEEVATITALREEEEQKKQMMKEKLEEMDRHISALSHTIKDMKEMMKANDVCFLKEIPVSMERVQISQPDPQMASGALIHVSRYLGNLPFRVWKKMQDIIQNTPVILDPNTAHPDLILSDDLTRVRDSRNKQPFPDNPERFDGHECVLGSEGFNSGTHCWDVEVKESRCWSLGVTTASNQRKGWDFFNTDVWSVQYGLDKRFGFPVEQDLDRVRVDLDYDRGMVSFSDPVSNTRLYTFTTTVTDTVYPFFFNLDQIDCIRILPVKLVSETENHCSI
ncbi:unnamed protein product [Leuciscus chuanchicus]